jgi:hypothetical protein
MILAVGQYMTFTLSFLDGAEGPDQLGPMAAPGVGTISAVPPNVVDASVAIVAGGTPQAMVTMKALNAGKTELTYTYEDTTLVIPVQVVRRVAKSVVVNKDSVSRYPLVP